MAAGWDVSRFVASFFDSEIGLHDICLLLLLCTCILFFVIRCWSNALRLATKRLLKHLLGVQVQIERMKINPFVLFVEIRGLTLGSPPGFSAEHMLSMDKVHVNLGVRRMLFSCGDRMLVQHMELHGVHVTVEKNFSTSNIQEALSHLDRVSSRSGGQGSTGKPGALPREDCRVEDSGSEDEGVFANVEVRQVVVNDVAVSLQVWPLAMSVKLADFQFQDLSSEFEERHLTVVLRLFFQTVMSSVLANIPEHVPSAFYRMADALSSSSASSEASAGSDDEGCERKCLLRLARWVD